MIHTSGVNLSFDERRKPARLNESMVMLSCWRTDDTEGGSFPAVENPSPIVLVYFVRRSFSSVSPLVIAVMELFGSNAQVLAPPVKLNPTRETGPLGESNLA